MASINAVVNTNLAPRLTQESKVDMQGIIATNKPTPVANQSEDNYVNLATSQVGKDEAQQDEQYSHQRYIALNAYKNFGKDENSMVSGAGTIGTGSAAAEEAQSTAQSLVGQDPAAAAAEKNAAQGDGAQGAQGQQEDDSKAADPNAAKGINGKELTEEEQQEVEDMKARDQEVRTHEQAHKSAGGQYAASPSYTYESGPDGKRYITDGEVSIDIGEEDDPQDTIDKMQVVKRAAMAPAEPSSQDRRVYAEASQKEAQARQELAEDKREEVQKSSEGGNSNATATSSSASAANSIPAQGTNQNQDEAPVQRLSQSRSQSQVTDNAGTVAQAQRTNAIAGDNNSAASRSVAPETEQQSQSLSEIVDNSNDIPSGNGANSTSTLTLSSQRGDDEVADII